MQLGVKKKLIGGFVGVNLIFVGLSGFQLSQSNDLRNRAIENNESSLAASDLSATLESAYLKITIVYGQAPNGDPTVVPELAKVVSDEGKKLNDAMAAFPKFAEGEELAQFDKVVASYKGLGDAATARASAKTEVEVAAATAQTMKAHNDFIANLGTLRTMNVEAATDSNKDLDANFQSTLQLMLVLLVVLAAGCLGFGWRIANRVAALFNTGATQLGESAQSLDGTSRRVRESAAETVQRVDEVNVTSQHVSQSVNTVAAAVEQMQASIEEIARSTGEATRVAESALQTVATTNGRVQTLGESSVEIGKVIEVITSIAEQTNLLALNATIEAARAGDAGKGFAVVANEVKELAKQTAQATEEISARIVAIQGDSAGAVEAIGEISTVMSQISDIQSTIASAIEEQSATTAEIGNNILQAAGGVNDIAGSIGAVANAARETLAEVGSTDQAAEGMHRLADGFRVAVEGGPASNNASASAAPAVTARLRQQPRRFLTDAPAVREPAAENRIDRTHV